MLEQNDSRKSSCTSRTNGKVFKPVSCEIMDELGDQINSRLETPEEIILPMAILTQQKIKHKSNN